MSKGYPPMLKRKYKCAIDVKMVPCDLDSIYYG